MRLWIRYGIANVIVHEFGAMLAKTMSNTEARKWLLDRRADVADLGHGTAGEVRAWLDEMPAEQLAIFLVGGIARAELPFVPKGLFAVTRSEHEFILPPLPNQLFTRDSSCWVGKGVFVNPMYWPARRPEAINLSAVYRFHHPRFKQADLIRYFDAAEEHVGNMSVEGGDVMPVGNGVVLIGMGERSTPQAVTEYARRFVSARECNARDCGSDAAGSEQYASGHGVFVLRPRRSDDISRYRRPYEAVFPVPD